MSRSSLIEKLLTRARRLAGLSADRSKADRKRTASAAGQIGFLKDAGHGPPATEEPIERVVKVGSSVVQLRFFGQPADGAAAAKSQVTHVEVVLPAIAQSEAQRLMLSKEHWAMVAHVLPRQRAVAVFQSPPGGQSMPTAEQSTRIAAEGNGSLIEAAIPAGAGQRLYLLDHAKLYRWATDHWRSLPEIEAVCEAFLHNWKSWRLDHRDDWTVAENFVACLQQLNKLRRRASDNRAKPAAERHPPATAASVALPPPPSRADECGPYARLLEDVLIRWDQRDALMALAQTLRQMLRQGTTNLPSDLRPRLILDLIEIRLHSLLAAVDIIPVSRRPKTPESERPKRPHGPPPGCPEWPPEADPDAVAALNSDTFLHATGMLKVMGYGVGKKAAISADRRRAILQYVFMGRLPPVNNALYTQEWGRPKSNRRLRKIANSLATFARNARRKKSSSWNHAIARWEADLAYLKKRYYDKRLRDWKWPETVRKRTN